MKGRFYIEDFENSQSFVVLRKGRTSETVATFSYHYGVSKVLIRRLAGTFARSMNVLSSNKT